MKLTFEKLRSANAKRGVEWMGGPAKLDDLLFTAVELGGESGEVLNAVKKLSRYLNKQRGGIPLAESKAAIAEELADVVICADRVAEALGINLGEATIAKFNKTSDKYGLSVKIEKNDLAFSELFATFPDDGSPRELSTEEQAKCRELEK